MKNTIQDLRNHLFETIEHLKDEDNPMDIKRAGAVKDVAQTIINSAKVELEYMDLMGLKGTGFVPADDEEKLPTGSRPRLVGSNQS